MCKSMTEFESLVQSIQSKKAEVDKIRKELAEQEEELKSYMKKRQKEEIASKSTGLIVSYKAIESMKFNKDLFIEAKGEKEYKKYLLPSTSMRLSYLKPKKA